MTLLLLQIQHCSKVHIKINNIVSHYSIGEFFCLLNKKNIEFHVVINSVENEMEKLQNGCPSLDAAF